MMRGVNGVIQVSNCPIKVTFATRMIVFSLFVIYGNVPICGN